MKKFYARLKRLVLRDPKRTLLFLAGTCLLLVGGFILWASSLRIPDLSSIENRQISQSTKIYDRTGEILLFAFHGQANRTVVPLEDIAPSVRNASIAIEDNEFYSHLGIKPTAIVRAVLSNILVYLNISDGYTQGGSTITQQVVKNALLTQDRRLSRKIKEWVLAVRLERLISKDRILEIYLNESPYGGNIYGVEEASMAFFGKHAKDLSIAESAYIAALPQAPTYYSPYGNHKDALEGRKNLVLRKMREFNYITEEEYENALAERVAFQAQKDTSIKAPHFVFYVREYLANKYGERALTEGGLRVITSLDYTLQSKAEEIALRGALANEKKFNAENIGLVAVDPRSGEILTMVGSRNYFDKAIDGNYNIALALRQPGSAFKPFVYATAFKKGYTPDTVVFDLKTQFSTACAPDNFSKADPCFSPDNYDGEFRGPVSFRNALAQSLNVPSVKVLYLAGLRESLRTARDMGITTLKGPERYGLTLVLGGGEVTLLDLTSAYGVFANDGVRFGPHAVLRVEDNLGNVLESYEPEPTEAIAPEIARTVTDVLSDNEARSPAFGEDSALHFPGRSVAAKTGTTNDYRDAWIVGYTPTIAVGAWAGNNDNTPMQKKVAGFIIAPLWHELMAEALKGVPEERFPPAPPVPEDIKPILRGAWQAEGGAHDILYYVKRSDPTGPYPTDAERAAEPQLRHWDYPVQRWASTLTPPSPAPGETGGESTTPVITPIIPPVELFPVTPVVPAI